MINTLVETLNRIARHDERVSVLSNDGEIYNGFSMLGTQYLCAGISECNMIGVAAGMASCGKKPFVIGGGTFLSYRAMEFIRNEVCLQNRNVKIIGIGAGLAISYLGSTHHCTEDIGVLRSIPNLRVVTPATQKELEAVLSYAYDCDSPVYIRLGRAVGEDFYMDGHIFHKEQVQIFSEGWDVILFASGSIVCDVLKVVKNLKEYGINATVVNVHTLVPIDTKTIRSLELKCRIWVSIEEHNIIGGLGSLLADLIVEERLGVSLKKIGIDNGFSKGHGSYEDMKELNGLGIEEITKKCIAYVGQ